MSRSWWMNGSAMFTMVPSSTTISCATEMSTSAHPRCCLLPELVLSALATSVIGVSFSRGSVGRSRLAGGGRQDDLVDHAGDQVGCRLLAHDEDAMQHDAGERRLEQGQVEVVAELAPVAGALPDLLGDRDLWADHLGAEGGVEVRVAGDRRDDAGEGRHGLGINEPA